MGLAPAASMACNSASVKSPSGPIHTAALCGKRPCCLLKFLKPFTRMAALGLQRADERQLDFFPAREKFGNGLRRGHRGQPGCAALLDGFDGDTLPFLALALRALAVELRDDAFGQQRHNAVRAQLDRFLDDALDEFFLSARRRAR